MAKWKPMTDEEFKRQHKLAVERGKEALKTEPRARSARYDPETDRLVIDLINGATFMAPRQLIQGLRDAPAELVAEVEIMDRDGFALHWEKLDQDFTVAGLLRGTFGTRAWMADFGRKGGRSTSEAKRAAARSNGARGGRPRKKRAA